MNNFIVRSFKTSFLAVSCLLTSISSNALTLHEALKHAYETNKIIKSHKAELNSSSLDTTKVVEQSLLPRVEFSASGKNSHEYTVDPDNWFKNTSESNTTQLRPNSLELDVTGKLNLYQNGASYNAIRAAKYQSSGAESKYYENEQEFFLKTAISHYLDYIKAKEIYEIAKNQLSFAEKQYEQAKLKLNLGEGTKVELSTAKAQLSKSKAKIHETKTKLSNAAREFINTFELEPTNLQTPELPDNSKLSLSSEGDDLQNNPSLKKLYNNKLAREKHYNSLLGRAGPSVDLIGKSTLSRGYDSDYNALGNPKRNNVASISLNWSLPGGYSDIRKEKYNMIATNYDYSQAKEQMSYKLLNGYDELNSLKEQNNSLLESWEAAKLALEAAEKSHKLGSLSMLDVLKREEEYSQIKEKLSEIKYQIYFKSYEILALKGELTANSLGLVEEANIKK